MKKLQSALGDHQDAVIAQGVDRELGVHAHLAGENAFSLGMLHGADSCDAQESERAAQRAWRRASQPKTRKWLK